MRSSVVSRQNIKTGGKEMMKKNEAIKRKVLQAVEKVARTEVEKNMYSWPPICLAIYHQPKRPKKTK